MQQSASGSGPEQARTQATAWASPLKFEFPQGTSSLEELGVRDHSGQLAPATAK